jgi:hypothetical protein
MRRVAVLIGAVAAGAAGCLEAPAVSPPEAPLEFVREVVADTHPAPVDCVPVGVCTTVGWEVPRARGSRPALRTALDAAVDSLLATAFRAALPEAARTTPRASAAAFVAAYDSAVGRGAAIPPWSFRAEVTVALASDSLITLALRADAFTGGAHPIALTRFQTLRRATGDPLPRWELWRDSTTVAAVVERFFRRARGLAPDADLAAAGFDVAAGFRLPAQLAVTRDGLRAQYDAFDIAPYALGPTEVLVPLDSVRAFLTPPALAPHRP